MVYLYYLDHASRQKLNTVLLLIGSLLICVNFGLIDRFIQDDNGSIPDRVEMQSGTLQYVSEDSIINNILEEGMIIL